MNINAAMKAAQSMIDDMRRKLAQAVKDEDWRRAGELDAYISGMDQIYIIFEMAQDKEATR